MSGRHVLGVVSLVFGVPICFLLGVVTYLLLDIVYGAGANTEGTATESELYRSSIAEPVALFIGGGGVVFCICLAIFTFWKRQKKR